jgi:DNA-binding LacI/PurR family transcriptional regulator
VFVNNEGGSADATDYLAGKGHKAIACVICRRQNLPAEDRLNGYKQALAKHGIAFNPALVFEVDDDTIEAGSMVFEKLSAAGVTAAFVPAGDMAAIGIVKEAKKRGIQVPGSLAVVGFDDIPAAEVIEPMLTTVRQPKLEMGDYAINMIVDKLEGRESEIKHKELPTKFIIRESA